MTSVRIFAAVNAAGEIRFIGDVPTGGACGCFCVGCGSPLVAKKGQINTWHFSHEARQERPECIVGAINLLRRITVEYLRSLPTLKLPPYVQVIARAISYRRVQQEVAWEAKVVQTQWLEVRSRDEPVARLTLDTECDADLFVDITNAPTRSYPTSSSTGSIAFSCFLPADREFRTEADVRQHVTRFGSWQWLHHPDVYGLIADVRRRFDALDSEEARIVAEQIRRNNEFLGRRQEDRKVMVSIEEPVRVPGMPEWTRHRRPNRSFFGYRYTSLGTWVLFEMTDGRCGLRKLRASGAWFEELADVRLVYDQSLELLVAPSFAVAQSAFREQAEATRISTDFSDMLQL